MIFESGNYTGDGSGETINLSVITGTPDFVWVKKTGGTATFRYPVYRMTGMTNSQRWGDTNNLANAITALGAGSFTLGTDTHVHENTATYVWGALFDDGNGDFEVGSYTGDANTTQDIVTGLSNLECVFVFPDTSSDDCWHCLAMGGATDATYICSAGTVPQTGYITDISTTAGQFTAGASLNTDGNTYRYIAFGPVAGYIDSIAYTGDGNDNRNLDVDTNDGGNTIEFACVGREDTADFNCWRLETTNGGHSGDEMSFWTAGDASSDRIQGFPSAETVQLGLNNDVNGNTFDYHMFWFLSNPAASGPSDLSMGGVIVLP